MSTIKVFFFLKKNMKVKTFSEKYTSMYLGPKNMNFLFWKKNKCFLTIMRRTTPIQRLIIVKFHNMRDQQKILKASKRPGIKLLNRKLEPENTFSAKNSTFNQNTYKVWGHKKAIKNTNKAIIQHVKSKLLSGKGDYYLPPKRFYLNILKFLHPIYPFWGNYENALEKVKIKTKMLPLSPYLFNIVQQVVTKTIR